MDMGRGEERVRCIERVTETYITICKIDSQREFAAWLRKLKQGLTLFWGAPKSLQMVTAAMKLKGICSLEEKLRHLVQFSSVQSLSHVQLFVTP